jgi:hypothetical protein
LELQRRETLRKRTGREDEARCEQASNEDEEARTEARETVATTDRQFTTRRHADARGGKSPMTTRKSRVKLSPRDIMHGKQYPGVRGKVVDWVDHAFEDDVLYLHVRFTDKTELCWRIGMSLVIEEADLSDWKTGNFKQLAVFAERELDPDPEQ